MGRPNEPRPADRWRILLSGGPVLVAWLVGGAPAESRIAADSLRRDLGVLWQAIDEAHGSPFAYRSRGALRGAFARASNDLRDLTEREFYAVVSRLLGAIRDTHTRAYPSVATMEELERSGRLFPAKLRFVGRRALVVASSTPLLARGDAVHRIDGRSGDWIARWLAPHLPIDGWERNGRRWYLGGQFDLMYNLLIGRPDSFLVEHESPDGHCRRERVGAASSSDTVTSADPPRGPLISLALLADSSIGLLRVASFSADEIAAGGQDYDSTLTSAFREIDSRSIRDLIIDVRGNEGGRDVYGARLLAHLQKRPFRYYRRLVARTDRVAFWRLTQLDSTFNQTWPRGLIRRGPHRFEFDPTRHSNLRMQYPIEPVYAGRTWLLVDGGTNSTAAEFAAVARSSGRGQVVLIGEPTGGVYEGNTSGTFAIVTLPASRIRVLIPLVRYELAVKPPVRRGKGVPVDHRVAISGRSLAAGRDPALETTLRLIVTARSAHH